MQKVGHIKMSILTTGNESKQHQKAKERLLNIVRDIGMQAEYEINLGTTETPLGKRNYTADIFAFWTHARTGTTKKIVFEVDGFKGHNSKRQIARDKVRSDGLRSKGIMTVRINMHDLVGKKKLEDFDIRKEIYYQLGRQIV